VNGIQDNPEFLPSEGEKTQKKGPSPGNGGPPRLLIYGYGNPGRQDDGLGPYIVQKVEGLGFPWVDTDADYQLQIEDADTISRYEIVIFVDAASEGREPFSVRQLSPAGELSYTTHHMEPNAVLGLCGQVYGVVPKAWIIGIRGYGFDVHEGLTDEAADNAKEAFFFISYIIQLLHRYKGRNMGDEQKTILIIDDDADLRASMRIVLEAAGFSVGEAADGEEGFKVADKIKPDAVIVDLMMETVDSGSKVTSRLKEKGYKGPMYLLSAAGDAVRYNIDAREMGLAGIFQKPVDHKVLIKTLKKQFDVA
jgi:hydrogenase maturation protease